MNFFVKWKKRWSQMDECPRPRVPATYYNSIVEGAICSVGFPATGTISDQLLNELESMHPTFQLNSHFLVTRPPRSLSVCYTVTLYLGGWHFGRPEEILPQEGQQCFIFNCATSVHYTVHTHWGQPQGSGRGREGSLCILKAVFKYVILYLSIQGGCNGSKPDWLWMDPKILRGY